MVYIDGAVECFSIFKWKSQEIHNILDIKIIKEIPFKIYQCMLSYFVR